MKILITSDGMWPPLVKMAGVSAIYNLQESLGKKGIQVHIYTTIEEHANSSWKKWFVEKEKKGNLHFHYLNLGPLKKLRKTHFYLSKLVSLFIVLILQYKYHFDIIHEYSSSPLLILRTGFYRSFFRVHTIHTLCTYSSKFESQSKFIRRVLLPNKIICTTHHMARTLKDTISFKNKVIYLPLGIILDRFKRDTGKSLVIKKRKFRLSLKSKIVLYVGLIDERKGIFDLAKTAPLIVEKNPDVIFLIVSFPLSGVFYDYAENKKKLLKIIEKNKTKEKFLFFEGICNIPELMSIVDIFVLPLTTMHGTLGYPLTLLEAMASRKAIVASNIDGVNELISHNKNGLLFPQGNIKMLAREINKLLSSGDLRDKLGREAKKSVREFDLDKTVRKLKAIYIDVKTGGSIK